MIRTIPTERILLALILAAGAGLRLWLLLGPYREIDADEAVVGLMAMQMPGEVPARLDEEDAVPALRCADHDLLPVRGQPGVPLLARHADDREARLGHEFFSASARS